MDFILGSLIGVILALIVARIILHIPSCPDCKKSNTLSCNYPYGGIGWWECGKCGRELKTYFNKKSQKAR